MQVIPCMQMYKCVRILHRINAWVTAKTLFRLMRINSDMFKLMQLLSVPQISEHVQTICLCDATVRAACSKYLSAFHSNAYFKAEGGSHLQVCRKACVKGTHSIDNHARAGIVEQPQRILLFFYGMIYTHFFPCSSVQIIVC